MWIFLKWLKTKVKSCHKEQKKNKLHELWNSSTNRSSSVHCFQTVILSVFSWADFQELSFALKMNIIAFLTLFFSGDCSLKYLWRRCQRFFATNSMDLITQKWQIFVGSQAKSAEFYVKLPVLRHQFHGFDHPKVADVCWFTKLVEFYVKLPVHLDMSPRRIILLPGSN